MLGDLIGSEHRQECLKCEAYKFGSESQTVASAKKPQALASQR
jgi:hypothetical protein